jgi:uncharacterized membrane protein YoaK (UPF0700 family)
MRRYSRPALLLAALLAALAGYIDAVGFLQLGGFFVSFMSGNSTRLGVGAALGDLTIVATAGGLIGLFVLGVIGGVLAAPEWWRWRRVSALTLVTALLAMAAWLAGQGSPASAAFAALAMGALNAVFQRDGDIAIGVTYMTGALVRMGHRIAAALRGGPVWGFAPFLMLWMASAPVSPRCSRCGTGDGARTAASPSAFHQPGQRGWVNDVFGGQHPSRQRFGRVAWQHRHAGLIEDRPLIDARRDQVHRAARLRIARLDGPPVGVEARVFRQQGGMDVDHPPGPGLDQKGRQHPHVAGQGDVLRARFTQGGVERALVGLAVGAEGPVIDGQGGHAGLGGEGEALGVRLVGEHEHHPVRAVGGFGGLDQRGHVAAAAGDEDGDLGAVGHCVVASFDTALRACSG